MQNASFITTEDGVDLIVSFAIPADGPDESADVKSLTLLRTPKYEALLDECERGVNVSFDDFPDDPDELLRQVVIEANVVTIISSFRTYTVSIADVDAGEIEQARTILKKMNYDSRFKVKMD